MGFTLSCDASPKVRKADVKGYENHAFRDVIDPERIAKGKEPIRHKNDNIDPSRTPDNFSFFYNHETGEHEELKESKDVEKSLKHRLKAVKPKLKKDGTPMKERTGTQAPVVVRPLILQLDPAWYIDHPDEEEQSQSFDDMFDWAKQHFGAENLVGGSIHWDEESPHMHLMFTPVTADGRLSQKDFFDGYIGDSNVHVMTQMHADFRQHMIDRGYEIEKENQPSTKARKHLSDEDYKTFAELKRQNKILDGDRKRVNEREKRVRERERALDARESDLNEREGKVTLREEKALKTALELSEGLERVREHEERTAEEERAIRLWDEATVNRGKKPKRKMTSDDAHRSADAVARAMQQGEDSQREL